MSDDTTSPAATETGDLTKTASSTTPVAASTSTQTAQTTSAVVEPWFNEWLQKDGTLNSKAYERMPDDLKHLAPSLANAKTIDDVMRKVANLSTLAGKKGLAPLPADAPPDAVKARGESGVVFLRVA